VLEKHVIHWDGGLTGRAEDKDVLLDHRGVSSLEIN